MRSLALSLALAAAACASEPPPTAELAAARAALGHAGAGVAQYAPAELSSAQRKLQLAEAAVARADNLKARRLAQQAEVDAQLAWAMAENERLRPAQ